MGMDPSLVHILGHRETLRLDARCRFRLPDNLAARLQQELGRVGDQSNLPPGAFQRLSFYFAPGTSSRIFLYPAPNIAVAVERFENPPAGQDPELVRTARDYFYGMLSFVEADRQNRLLIPEHLREHAAIDPAEGHVVLVCHDLWLTILRGSAAEQFDVAGGEALEEVGPSVLDPVNPAQPSARESAQQ